MATDTAEVEVWIYLVFDEHSKIWRPHTLNTKINSEMFHFVESQTLTFKMPPRDALTAHTVAELQAKIRKIQSEAAEKVAAVEEILQNLLALPAPTEDK